MMKRFARRFVLPSLLVFGLFCVESEGMQRSKSRSDILSQHQAASITHKRGSSDPVTMQEKVRAIEICNVDDFQQLTLDEAKKLKSVTFRNMEINEKFVEKFWELFSSGVDNLTFDQCNLSDDCDFSDLLDGDYQVTSLSFTSCGIDLDDVDSILCRVYPYYIKNLNLTNNGLKYNELAPLLRDRLGSFASLVNCSV